MELGAGIGMTGMAVAACCGARRVVLTDYAPKYAVQHAKRVAQSTQDLCSSIRFFFFFFLPRSSMPTHRKSSAHADRFCVVDANTWKSSAHLDRLPRCPSVRTQAVSCTPAIANFLSEAPPQHARTATRQLTHSPPFVRVVLPLRLKGPRQPRIQRRN